MTTEGLHLVALSGGADSIALLLILKELGYRVEAVHCNFHLRGEESNRDEQFVRILCSEKEIPLHLIHFDTVEYTSVHQVSIEMAARQLRYHYFEQLRHDLGAETVCVGHHRNDAVETLLMNLMRGAGIHGLTGIRPRNGYIVRPLLCVTRDEIEVFLHDIRQQFITDSTNLKPDVLRNKVRLQLLPLMEQMQPGTVSNLARSAYYLSEAEKVYDAGIAQERETGISGDKQSSCLIPYASIHAAPSPLCLLHELLAPLGFNRTQTEQILAHLDEGAGREFTSATHILVIDREGLFIEPKREPMKPLKMPEPGCYRLDETAQTDGFTHCRAELLESVTDAVALISRKPMTATLDAATVSFPLTVRPVQQGDRFQPYGMKGQKLISDFLTDMKIPLLHKRRQLVVTDASGTILWLVGLRTSHLFRVTAETNRLLRLTFR